MFELAVAAIIGFALGYGAREWMRREAAKVPYEPARCLEQVNDKYCE